MKHQRTIVRAAALLSSVSIVTVYVSCRTNDAKPPAGQGVETKQTEHMGGSKSEAIFVPPAPTPEPKQMMGGSKSRAIINAEPAPSKPK